MTHTAAVIIIERHQSDCQAGAQALGFGRVLHVSLVSTHRGWFCCNRVWNKGDGHVKLICIAPKLGAPGVPVNSGPTIGVNTSDRNSTETNDAWQKASSSKSDCGAQRPSTNGSKSNGGDSMNGRNGNDGQESIGSQLGTNVGSLHLTAPGTS